MTEKRRYPKYKKNLFTIDFDIFSYGTKVAKYDPDKGGITLLGWWSQTTSKHINYIANLWDFDIIKEE